MMRVLQMVADIRFFFIGVSLNKQPVVIYFYVMI